MRVAYLHAKKGENKYERRIEGVGKITGRITLDYAAYPTDELADAPM